MKVSQGGVTGKRLISKAADYLCIRQFENRDEALAAAGEFITFCRGELGSSLTPELTKVGENLYQFTHRTFLEYFAACP